MKNIQQISQGDLVVEVRLLEQRTESIDHKTKDHGDRIYKIEIKNIGFEQTQKIVFGFLGILFVAFSGAIISLVIHQ